MALRDESSTAALYAAVLAAGYGIRDTDGSIMQTNMRGQGLILNAWELAATAKLYGEDYGVMLSHLSEAFVRSVPELKNVPLANVLLDGIRAGANSTQPSARFLSRFIVELGGVVSRQTTCWAMSIQPRLGLMRSRWRCL